LIVVDADVLGRNRTGEETYVLNLLRQLPRVAPDLSFGAVTRHPELVPDGVSPLFQAALEATEEAVYMRDTILPAMAEVRKYADALERVVADDLWPLPKYSEILFIK